MPHKNAPSKLLCYYKEKYTPTMLLNISVALNTKSTINSFLWQDFLPDDSLTFAQFPDISPTAVKFPDIARFFRHPHTFIHNLFSRLTWHYDKGTLNWVNDLKCEVAMIQGRGDGPKDGTSGARQPKQSQVPGRGSVSLIRFLSYPSCEKLAQ